MPYISVLSSTSYSQFSILNFNHFPHLQTFNLVSLHASKSFMTCPGTSALKLPRTVRFHLEHRKLPTPVCMSCALTLFYWSSYRLKLIPFDFTRLTNILNRFPIIDTILFRVFTESQAYFQQFSVMFICLWVIACLSKAINSFLSCCCLPAVIRIGLLMKKPIPQERIFLPQLNGHSYDASRSFFFVTVRLSCGFYWNNFQSVSQALNGVCCTCIRERNGSALPRSGFSGAIFLQYFLKTIWSKVPKDQHIWALIENELLRRAIKIVSYIRADFCQLIISWRKPLFLNYLLCIPSVVTYGTYFLLQYKDFQWFWIDQLKVCRCWHNIHKLIISKVQIYDAHKITYSSLFIYLYFQNVGLVQ